MVEKIDEPQFGSLGRHIGTASLSTRSRVRLGRSPGVRRSTWTPSSSSSFTWSPPRSSKVGTGNRVDEDVEIACLGVATVYDGPKYARVSRAILLHELSNLAPMKS